MKNNKHKKFSSLCQVLQDRLELLISCWSFFVKQLILGLDLIPKRKFEAALWALAR